jgi:hypothetical protein
MLAAEIGRAAVVAIADAVVLALRFARAGIAAHSASRSLVVGQAQFGPDNAGRDVLARLGQSRLGGGEVGRASAASMNSLTWSTYDALAVTATGGCPRPVPVSDPTSAAARCEAA